MASKRSHQNCCSQTQEEVLQLTREVQEVEPEQTAVLVSLCAHTVRSRTRQARQIATFVRCLCGRRQTRHMNV